MKKYLYSFLFILMFASMAVNAQSVNIKTFNFKVDSGFTATWDDVNGIDGQNDFTAWSTDTSVLTAWQSWEQGTSGNIKIGHKVTTSSQGMSYLVFPKVSTTGYEALSLAVYTASPNPFTGSGHKFFISAEADPGTKDNFDPAQWTAFSDSLFGHDGGATYNFKLPDGFEDKNVTLMCVMCADSTDIDADKWIHFWSFTLKGLPALDVQQVKMYNFLTDSGFSDSWSLPLGMDGQGGFVTWSTDTSLLRPFDAWSNAQGVVKVGNMVQPFSHGQSYLVFPPMSTLGYINLRLALHAATFWPAPATPFENTGHSFYLSTVDAPGVKENFDIEEWTKLPEDLLNYSAGSFYTIPFPAGFEQQEEVHMMVSLNADSNEIADQTWMQYWSFTVNGLSSVPIEKYDVMFGVVSGIDPVEGAEISIAGEELITDDQGVAIIALQDGKYAYSVTKEGFDAYTDTVIVEGSDQQVGVVLVALDPCIQFFEFRTDLDYCDPPFSEFTWDKNDVGMDGECGYITWADTATGMRPWQTWAEAVPQIKMGNYFNSGTDDVPGGTGKSIIIFPPRSTEGCKDLKLEFTIIWDDLPNDMEHYDHTFYVSKEADPGVKENLDMDEWVQIGDPIRNVDPGAEFSLILPESFNNQANIRFMSILDIREPENKGQWHWIQFRRFKLDGITYEPSGVRDAEASGCYIYPNPAADQLNVKGLSAPAVISIYNLLGASVLEQYVTGDMTMDVESLKSGMYLIKIRGEKDQATLRFLKQ